MGSFLNLPGLLTAHEPISRRVGTAFVPTRFPDRVGKQKAVCPPYNAVHAGWFCVHVVWIVYLHCSDLPARGGRVS